MSVSTLLRFLRGDREAILKIASCPSALWIGLLFVFAAGFAREWDRESLLHEPWHLLLPLAASLVTSFVLFSLFYWMPRDVSQARPAFGSAYRAFLQVFWMTAPMAWLYAVPWDRFLSAGDATAASLWTLGIVSVWRVLLITRVISVLFGCSAVGAFFIVMLYADIAAITAISMLPFPIISIMGGVELGESEQIIAGIAFTVVFFGILTGPVWLIGSLVALVRLKPRWMLRLSEPVECARGFGSLGRLALASILLGLLLLPIAQPEQMRRHHAERMLRSGQIEEAIAYMSQFERADFPPHWDPPPRQAYRDFVPDVDAVVSALQEHEHANWVRAAYARKVDTRCRGSLRFTERGKTWASILQAWEDNPGSIHFNDAAEFVRHAQLILDFDRGTADADREALTQLIETAQRWIEDRSPDRSETNVREDA